MVDLFGDGTLVTARLEALLELVLLEVLDVAVVHHLGEGEGEGEGVGDE